MQAVKIKIEKVCGDNLETLHADKMSMGSAMDLAWEAANNLDVDDYFTVIRILTPEPNAIFSFSRTETTILLCLNGKPCSERSYFTESGENIWVPVRHSEEVT